MANKFRQRVYGFLAVFIPLWLLVMAWVFIKKVLL